MVEAFLYQVWSLGSSFTAARCSLFFIYTFLPVGKKKIWMWPLTLGGCLVTLPFSVFYFCFRLFGKTETNHVWFDVSIFPNSPGNKYQKFQNFRKLKKVIFHKIWKSKLTVKMTRVNSAKPFHLHGSNPIHVKNKRGILLQKVETFEPLFDPHTHTSSIWTTAEWSDQGGTTIYHSCFVIPNWNRWNPKVECSKSNPW